MRSQVCWGASLCPPDPLSANLQHLCSITQTRVPPSFLLVPGNDGPCLETGAQERGWSVPSPIAESLQAWLDSLGSGTRINQWIQSQKTQGSPALQLSSSVNWVGHPETKSQFPLKLNGSISFLSALSMALAQVQGKSMALCLQASDLLPNLTSLAFVCSERLRKC